MNANQMANQVDENDPGMELGAKIAVGAMLAVLTLPPAFGLLEVRYNLADPIEPGETLRVASNLEHLRVSDGAFPRTGGVVKINSRELWKFHDDQGRVVGVSPKQIPNLKIGDEVTVDRLGVKIGEASLAHITIRGTGRE